MSFFKDKVVLLTGASSGIGWATGLAFAERGAKVALAARRKEKLDELAALIGSKTETLIVPCDVSDSAQGRAAVKAVLARWGRIDYLINNAGVMATARFHEQNFAELEAVMRTNYTGAAAMIQEALPAMLKRGEGHVVNVASMAGVMGFPYMASYSASKYALVGLTESLRREYRDTGVTFTAFCPGSVDTPMTVESLSDEKLGKLARPKTAAQVAEKIVAACRSKTPEVLYGDAPGFLLKLSKFIPGTADWLIGVTYKRLHPLGRKALVLLAALALCAPARALTMRELRTKLEAAHAEKMKARYPQGVHDALETTDGFLAGDPDAPVTGIAVAWMAGDAEIELAHNAGANLFVVHELPYGLLKDFTGANGTPKASLLKKYGMAVYRAHFVWDTFPELGVGDAWPKWLGFPGKPAKRALYYEVFDTDGASFGSLAKKIAERARALGQAAVKVVGDPARKTSKIVFGTGARTHWREMDALGADVLVLTDDGADVRESALWAQDEHKSLLIVDHATSEEPGMKTLAEFLKTLAAPVHVTYLPVGCVYQAVGR